MHRRPFPRAMRGARNLCHVAGCASGGDRVCSYRCVGWDRGPDGEGRSDTHPGHDRSGGQRCAEAPLRCVAAIWIGARADPTRDAGESQVRSGRDWELYRVPIDFYRTAFHELGHWTGHMSRLGRDQTGRFGDAFYAREELVAEMTSAFVCAELSIEPNVRHSDYIGSWLEVLREDNRAIFRAASAASKAADFLLAYQGEADAGDAS